MTGSFHGNVLYEIWNDFKPSNFRDFVKTHILWVLVGKAKKRSSEPLLMKVRVQYEILIGIANAQSSNYEGK